MKLYDLDISGNCYKVRLFLSLLGVDYTRVPVDVKAGDNRSSEFLVMNPNGLVPILTDGVATIYDSAAILTYLASTYGDDHWLPSEPVLLARTIRWLAFEQSEGRYGLARARAMVLKLPSPLARLGSLEESQSLGQQALEALNRQLATTRWLAGGADPTICDIACYPYTALSGDGGLSLKPFSAVARWLREIEAMNAYVALPKSG